MNTIFNSNNSLIKILSAGIIYMFNDEIKQFFYSISNKISERLTISLKINTNFNPKCLFVIKQIINEYNINNNHILAEDGYESPNYKLQEGNYYLITEYGRLIIIYEEDIITIKSSFLNSIENLKLILNDNFSKYFTEGNNILFNLPTDDGDWGRPIFRDSRLYDEEKLTSEMLEILSDIDEFINSQELYIEQNRPYRRGYLLEGRTGTGKTTTVEIIASKYNKSVYQLMFNSNNMTDTTIANLINTVPPNSIIVIEEIEKQILNLSRNVNNNLSEGGILMAIDGPCRLSNGTIVIATANDVNLLNSEFIEYLTRPGRIDKHYMYLTQFE